MSTADTEVSDAVTGAPPSRTPALRPSAWRLAAPGLVIGSISALYRLDHRGLWLDEAYTLGSVHQLRSAVPETSWTMSAYYAGMRVWLLASESVWWMRLPSVLAALAAVVLTVALARRVVGPAGARLTGLLVALSPLWLSYAREARSYGFVMLAVAASWLVVDEALAVDDHRSRRRWWSLHTAIAVLLPFLHGLSLLQLAPQLVLVAIVRPDRATWWRALRGVGLSFALTLALARTASAEVGGWVSPLGSEELGFTIEAFLSRWAVVCAALGVLVLLGATVCTSDARRAATAMERGRAAVPLLWGVAPLGLLVGLSLFRPSLVPRYAIGCVPGLAVLMAVAVERCGGSGGRRVGVRATVALAVVVALAAGHVDHHRKPVDGWTYAARLVADEIMVGDTILLSREATTRPPFEAAWREVAPAAPPVLPSLDRPLGEVVRFEPDETDNTLRWNEARGAGRMWLIGDAHRLELDRLPSLTTDGQAGRPASHREVRRWHAPDSTIYVVLLEPI